MSFVFLQKGIEKTSIYYVHRKKHTTTFFFDFTFFVDIVHLESICTRTVCIVYILYQLGVFEDLPSNQIWIDVISSEFFSWNVLQNEQQSKTQVVSKSQNDYLDIH